MEYLELTRINGCEESLLLDNCRPFKIITEKLSIDEKKIILDLGRANSTNLDYFSEYHCKIYIENIFDTILENEKNNSDLNDEERTPPDYNSMFYCDSKNLDSGHKGVDIIFCWELLNYIPREHIRSFIEALLKFSQPSTLFHAFIATQATMADVPLEYSIKGDLTMERNTISTKRIKAPRYNQFQLYKFMPEFKVIKSILHRNGMQEYLFSIN